MMKKLNSEAEIGPMYMQRKTPSYEQCLTCENFDIECLSLEKIECFNYRKKD